jgi:hypothetical protein
MARGGKRLGAGRPSGSENRDTAAARAALSALLDVHVKTAIAALAHIAATGQSEAARVSAACAILDRCYGRPAPQAVQDEGGAAPYPTRIVIEAASPRVDLSRLSTEALEELVAAQDAAGCGSGSGSG